MLVGTRAPQVRRVPIQRYTYSSTVWSSLALFLRQRTQKKNKTIFSRSAKHDSLSGSPHLQFLQASTTSTFVTLCKWSVSQRFAGELLTRFALLPTLESFPLIALPPSPTDPTVFSLIWNQTKNGWLSLSRMKVNVLFFMGSHSSRAKTSGSFWTLSDGLHESRRRRNCDWQREKEVAHCA